MPLGYWILSLYQTKEVLMINNGKHCVGFLKNSMITNRIMLLRKWLDDKPLKFLTLTHKNSRIDSLVPTFSSVQSLTLVWLFVTPWIPARQASLVHHQLLEFTQTHVHWVGDAIQPSHPLSSPSPPALSPSQHQGLFQWVCSSNKVLAKRSEFQLQHQSFQ